MQGKEKLTYCLYTTIPPDRYPLSTTPLRPTSLQYCTMYGTSIRTGLLPYVFFTYIRYSRYLLLHPLQPLCVQDGFSKPSATVPYQVQVL